MSSRPGTAYRSAAVGVAASPLHTRAFERAEQSFQEGGVEVAAGVTHVWELPVAGVSLEVVGDAAARVTTLDRAGRVRLDVELEPHRLARIGLGAHAALVAVTGLGAHTGEPVTERAMGAVSLRVGSGGRPAACGWELEDSALGCSALRRCSRAGRRSPSGPPWCVHPRLQLRSTRQRSPCGGARRPPALETRLPSAVRYVAVLLEGGTSDGLRDVAVVADGAELGVPYAIERSGGVALVYGVSGASPAGDALSVSVARRAGWRLTGVVGMTGSADDWADRLAAPGPTGVVDDGPLSPYGAVTARLAPAKGRRR